MLDHRNTLHKEQTTALQWCSWEDLQRHYL
jgi:hypothetical protein